MRKHDKRMKIIKVVALVIAVLFVLAFPLAVIL